MNRKESGVIEYVVFVVLILVIAGLLLPVFLKVTVCDVRAKDLNHMRQIVTLMLMYADDDIEGQLMPIPSSAFDSMGKVKKWSEKGNESTDVAFSLLDKNIVEDVSLFKSKFTKAPYLSKNIKADPSSLNRWDENSPLDFQIYSEYKLKSTSPASTIMSSNIDGPTLDQCQYGGRGWYVVFLDGSGKWYDRKYYEKYIRLGSSLTGPADDRDKRGFLMSSDRATYRGGGSSAFMGLEKNSRLFEWMAILPKSSK